MRPEFLYVKTTKSYRLWAVGWSTYRTKSGKEIISVAAGPYRFHWYRMYSEYDKKQKVSFKDQ